MKKKLVVAMIILAVLAALLVPIKTQFRDGGTTFYTAILYRVISWNALINADEKKTGTEVHFIPNNFRAYEYYFDPLPPDTVTPVQTTVAAPMEPTTPPVTDPREMSAALKMNEALLAELGMTYEVLAEKYGPRAGQDGTGIQFEKGCGYYHFYSNNTGTYPENPAPTDRCRHIVVPAITLFPGLTGPMTKEDFLKAYGIRDGDGYGPVLKDGYNHHTVMHFGDLDSYELSIWHNEKNAFGPDDLVLVLGPN